MFPECSALVPFSADKVPAHLCRRDNVQPRCFFGILGVLVSSSVDNDLFISATEMVLKFSPFLNIQHDTAVSISS